MGQQGGDVEHDFSVPELPEHTVLPSRVGCGEKDGIERLNGMAMFPGSAIKLKQQ